MPLPRRSPLAPRPSPLGFTVAELLVVVAILALLLTLAGRRLGAAADRLAVHHAAGDLATIFASARQQAIHRRATVALDLDTAAGIVRLAAADDLLLTRPLRSVYGVRLSATRDSMAYDARGLGFGAANLSVVVRRGAAVETLFVSRLGRVRW